MQKTKSGGGSSRMKTHNRVVTVGSTLLRDRSSNNFPMVLVAIQESDDHGGRNDPFAAENGAGRDTK
eukprot:CAMPEP_0206490392 /NCGR_PEP_ID=MMETSP0324_2-20121206/44054_1 /ASSEMBLY_ACC=CAM_ASM_000836 /TAXON_ID=2866 /ORGANISM="Crypthecodinium cohnii, Strain Seligo" /LENGTH=66 /DNA_ID=CAMNT_0053970745 /DNA_START=26 /DNA_END=223 /DNA_ORIENTATION=-